MEKRNILLLSLLSLGFANSTAPEQAEQSAARPHIQFVQRVDDSIQRAEANNLPAGDIHEGMSGASALYYDGNELRTDTDLLARALKEGYARPFLLFGQVPSGEAWDAKMSMLSKRKHIPGLAVDAQDAVASFLYAGSNIGMYRYSVGENGLHVDGIHILNAGINPTELITLTQAIFANDIPDFFLRACQCANIDFDSYKKRFEGRIYSMIKQIFGIYALSMGASRTYRNITITERPCVLIDNPHVNDSDYRALAINGVVHLFDSVKQNLVSDYVQYTTEARIWDEGENLNSRFEIALNPLYMT